MVSEDDEVTRFQHVAEMLHGLIDSQQLPIVGAVFLLCRVEFLGEECQCLSGVVDTFLQHDTHDKWRRLLRVQVARMVRDAPVAWHVTSLPLHSWKALELQSPGN
jgi:hypothetical protein